MNSFNKLRAMLRDMEDGLGIWGDIIGGLCLFGMLFIGLFFVGVFQWPTAKNVMDLEAFGAWALIGHLTVADRSLALIAKMKMIIIGAN